MNEIIYCAEFYGKEVINSRGKKVKVRKYHLTEDEIKRNRRRWLKDIQDVSEEIKDQAGDKFFNPFRKGIYYYQIKSLFLLGCNKWHSLPDIISKLSSLMQSIEVEKKGVKMNAWEIFRGRSYQTDTYKSKDYIGKIQENFIFFQRLSHLHPYGYKLKQACSAIDIKRSNKEGFSSGLYSYRLSTYKTEGEAFPIRDFSEFNFPRHENKYISYKFIGKIITKGEKK